MGSKAGWGLGGLLPDWGLGGGLSAATFLWILRRAACSRVLLVGHAVLQVACGLGCCSWLRR